MQNKMKGDDKIKHCKKIKIALYILYCEFRLCVTDAQIGADKGIGLSPYPYDVYVITSAPVQKLHCGIYSATSLCVSKTSRLAQQDTSLNRKEIKWQKLKFLNSE